jgi:hypothetical protein
MPVAELSANSLELGSRWTAEMCFLQAFTIRR